MSSLVKCPFCGRGLTMMLANGYLVCSQNCTDLVFRVSTTVPPGNPTLRDRFAMAALQGMLAHPQCDAGTDTARYAYRLADAMLEARGEESKR